MSIKELVSHETQRESQPRPYPGDRPKVNGIKSVTKEYRDWQWAGEKG